jgi:hypothetical protein
VQQARGVRDAVLGSGVQHGIDEQGGYAVMTAIHRSLPKAETASLCADPAKVSIQHA